MDKMILKVYLDILDYVTLKTFLAKVFQMKILKDIWIYSSQAADYIIQVFFLYILVI